MSSLVKSLNNKCLASPSDRSYAVTSPAPLKSNILNASNRLKSDFNASSILADSTSLSLKTISFRTFVNSSISILSNFGAARLDYGEKLSFIVG